MPRIARIVIPHYPHHVTQRAEFGAIPGTVTLTRPCT